MFVSLAGHFADDDGVDQDLYAEATVVRMRLGVERVVVRLAGGSEYAGEHTFPTSAVFPANPETMRGADNLARMSHLNEPAVLRALEDRYETDAITRAPGTCSSRSYFQTHGRDVRRRTARDVRRRTARGLGRSNDDADAAAARLRGRRAGVRGDDVQGEGSGARRRRRVRRGKDRDDEDRDEALPASPEPGERRRPATVRAPASASRSASSAPIQSL